MRVLIATPIFPPEIGGPATYTAELARELVERGNSVTVVTFSRGTVDKIPGVDVVQVSQVGTMLGRQRRLLSTLVHYSQNADIIYSQGGVDVGLGSLITARYRGLTFIVKYVGDLSWEPAYVTGKTRKLLDKYLERPDAGLYYDLIRRIQGFVLRRADLVVVPSEYLKDLLVKHYCLSRKKIHVILNSVDLDAYARITPDASISGYPRLSTIGRFVPWKNIDGIIEAMSILITDFPEARLYIIGSGPEQGRLEVLVDSLDLGKNITFTGRLEHDATLSIVKGTDTFLLNSSYEGLPHVVIEAMALGIPVVATDIEGTRETIEDGVTGYLFPLGSTGELTDRIKHLIEDAPRRERIVKRARKSLATHFNWKRNVSVLEGLFKELVGQR